MASIQYFIPAAITQKNGVPDSDTASVRYRVIVPALQLARRGHAIAINQIPPDATGSVDPASVKADIAVFSKSLAPAINEPLAEKLRAMGKKVVIDQCDNHFDHPKVGTKYREHNIRMCRLASTVVASTPRLAELIAGNTGITPTVVSDPVEGPRREARFEPRFPRVKLLWFGHTSNWRTIAAELSSLGELARQNWPVELTIVTRATPDMLQQIKSAGVTLQDQRLVVTFVEWSNEAVWAALAECDIVIIPSGSSDFHAAKSPNRMAEALWAGRHVVAHPVPSYEPFADFAWLGSDIAAGVRQAVENPRDIPERIRRGQTYIERHHTPYAIGNAWENALGLAPASKPLRLNLGCGDKILPDYVNVDVVESRKNTRPDILCDLHRLAGFADNSADEILSVHVVEHFWHWEVRDILGEWMRVLKPGGKMVLECPNLEAACRHFLEDPVLHARADQNGQRSMWVFYGDPAWKDPYMIHRWGYTPDSLAALMRDVGLADVRQEPAQYKLREPRDMRITGMKPG